MRRFWLQVLVMLAFIFGLMCVPIHCTTVTGTIKVQGQPFSGTMVVQLAYPGTNTTNLNLPQPASYRVSQGTFGSITLDGNDILYPRGTYYLVAYVDPYGNTVARMPYYISGTTYDLGAAVPLPVTTNNVNFMDVSLRNVIALNINVTNAITIGNCLTGPCTTYSSTGVSGAQQLNGIRFSQNYQLGSTTCGIAEAMTSLPPTGGLIYLQPGNCIVTSTISITKPVTLIGFGSGGYADNTTFTSYNAQTTLTNGAGADMFIITPSTTISDITFRDMMLDGNTATGNLISAGATGTATITNLRLQNVQMVRAGSAGLNAIGTINNLYIVNSGINSNGGAGVIISPLTGLTIANASISGSVIYNNGSDGVAVGGVGTVGRVAVSNSAVDHNGANGINVTSTTASLNMSGGSASTNLTAGVSLTGGVGHVVRGITALGNGRQAYGVFIAMPALASSTQVTLGEDNLSGNGTKDIQVNASTSYVLHYPDVNQSEAISDSTLVIRYIVPSSTFQVQSAHAAGCTTAASTFSTCTTTVAFPVAFSNTSYDASCTGQTPSDARASINGYTITDSQHVLVTTVTNGSVAVSYGNISCVGVHN